jgi:hypothetical protein
MSEESELTKKQATAIIFLVIGLVIGGLFSHYFMNTGGIDVECVSLEIEKEMNKALDKGYFMHGLLSLDNTIQAGITWYNKYNEIGSAHTSRHLLQQAITRNIQKCKKND